MQYRKTIQNRTITFNTKHFGFNFFVHPMPLYFDNKIFMNIKSSYFFLSLEEILAFEVTISVIASVTFYDKNNWFNYRKISECFDS